MMEDLSESLRRNVTDDDYVPYLAPTEFLDIDSAAVGEFTDSVIANAQSSREKAILLFEAVRDRIWYDPYSVSENPRDYRASSVLEAGRAYCVPKAVLLTAVCRAAGIPARLGFADVRNHLQTERLRTAMRGSDLFVFHGYACLCIEGRWVKATPAFNAELCAKFGVAPVNFDGRHDALLQAFAPGGASHMQYVEDRGLFDDLPLQAILRAFRDNYGWSALPSGSHVDAFAHSAGRNSASETFASETSPGRSTHAFQEDQ